MCPSPVLPHAISAQNCAEFEVKHKSKSSWTHSNPGTWKLVLILKWKTDGLATTRSVAKDSTTIWNGLYPRDPGNSEFGTNPGRQKMGRKSNLMKQSRFFWVHWYKNCFNACSRIKHGCPRWTTSAQKPLVFRLTRISRFHGYWPWG